MINLFRFEYDYESDDMSPARYEQIVGAYEIVNDKALLCGHLLLLRSPDRLTFDSHGQLYCLQNSHLGRVHTTLYAALLVCWWVGLLSFSF